MRCLREPQHSHVTSSDWSLVALKPTQILWVGTKHRVSLQSLLPMFANTIVMRNGKIVWKVVWFDYYLWLNVRSWRYWYPGFLLHSVWPGTEYTWTLNWKKSLLIYFESYQGIPYSHTGRVDRGWWLMVNINSICKRWFSG